MKVERLLNLMLHSRQKRVFPFCREARGVLGMAEAVWVWLSDRAAFSGMSGGTGVWPTSFRASGTGETVRGTLVGDRAGGVFFGEPEWCSGGFPLRMGEEGEVASNLRVRPFTLSLCGRRLGLGGVSGAPSRGLRLGLGLTPAERVSGC